MKGLPVWIQILTWALPTTQFLFVLVIVIVIALKPRD